MIQGTVRVHPWMRLPTRLLYTSGRAVRTHAAQSLQGKYDGFRALAEIEYGRCRLILRNGNPFATFQDLAVRIGKLFPDNRVVLDGEIVCPVLMNVAGRCSMTSL